MKINKILAGVSAMAIAATMAAIPASAATVKAGYLYTVQASWNQDAPADDIEGTVKFTDGTKSDGACDVKNWDTGDTKYNGQWAQYILESNDLSDVKVTFQVTADSKSTWEYHTWDDTKTAESQAYQVFLALGNTETLSWKDTVGKVATTTKDGYFVAGVTGTWTYTYSLKSFTVDAQSNLVSPAGKKVGKLQANDDGTYTLGMNIQVGHITNAKVTGIITGSKIMTDTTDGAAAQINKINGNNDAIQGTSNTTKKTTTTTKKSDSSNKTTTTKKGDSASNDDNGNGGNTNNGGNSNNNSGNNASSANKGNTSTGAAAGVALACIALAGAAVIVTKKK